MFWSLTMVVSIKYLMFLMRADNDGEGGILALLALVTPKGANGGVRRNGMILVGLFGAALLYGDGVITPAISVLSAVEGLRVATRRLRADHSADLRGRSWSALFVVQRRGTAGIGAVFGPAMLVWFVTIGGLGLAAILTQHPQQVSVLAAVNPMYAVRFFAAHGTTGFLVLGAVVLCVTGGEALYADMGHFGPRPIRLAWYAVAFPALLLNYFGQGALLLAHGAAVTNPFYQLAPAWALYPLVALSTVATIIASQALISGAFSLTQQAVQLGYAPRLTIIHTSGSAAGQIYMPEINWLADGGLRLPGAGLQELEQPGGRLRHRRHRHDDGHHHALLRADARTLALVGGQGWRAWSPSSCSSTCRSSRPTFPRSSRAAGSRWSSASSVFTVLTTWKRGRSELARILARSEPADRLVPAAIWPLHAAVPRRRDGGRHDLVRRGGAAGPPAPSEAQSDVAPARRAAVDRLREAPGSGVTGSVIEIADLGQGFYRVVAHFGFMETPRISQVLALCQARGLTFDMMSTTFVLGRETLLPSGRSHDGPLAQTALRRAGAQRALGDGVLRDPAEPRHRAGRADRAIEDRISSLVKRISQEAE